ncbi:hypothetical protein GCM10027094_36030 [Hafnia psychrotolerans]
MLQFRNRKDVLAGVTLRLTASLHGDSKGNNDEKKSAVTVSVTEPDGCHTGNGECGAT